MNPRATEVLAKIIAADLTQFADVVLDGPNVRSRLSGETPLHIIAIWGEVDSAAALIEAGAALDVPGEEGYTPLHEAICQGHQEMIALLVARGASLTVRSRHGDALALARASGDPAIELFIRERMAEQVARANRGSCGGLVG